MVADVNRRLARRREEFRLAVKASGGKVAVLIHPFFGVADPRYDAAMSQLRRRLTVPLVILEEVDKERETAERFANLRAFMVPTELRQSKPIMTWPALHRSMQEDGVKTVLVAGQLSYARTSEPPNREAEEIERRSLSRPMARMPRKKCAGSAYVQFLGAGFEKVRTMPALLFPHRSILSSRLQKPGKEKQST